jgi:hypothetical protein
MFPQVDKFTTPAYKVLVPMLIENKVKRCLFLSTPTYTATGDKPSWKWYMLLTVLWLTFRNVYSEVQWYREYVAS